MESFYSVISCRYLCQDTFSKKICLPVLIGALTSIWSSTVFIAAWGRSFDYEPFIVDGIRHTHYFISATVTVSLVYGLKKNKKYLLLPWIHGKGFECLLYLTSLRIFFEYNRYQIFGPIGIGIFIVNIYLIWFIWKVFKTIPDSPPKYSETPPEKVVNVDLPPKFEECTTQVSNV